MSAPSTPDTSLSGGVVGVAAVDPKLVELAKILETLADLSEDGSVPRNVRRGAAAAKEELARTRVALDLRIASAVNVLDDLANDANLPTHGRTAIWSIISSLETVR